MDSTRPSKGMGRGYQARITGEIEMGKVVHDSGMEL